jgi:hypothetical protein
VGAPGPSWPGRDQEDDESYRYRIHLKLISQSGSNESAIRFDLLQVPGIQDVVFDRRAGTFYCYVYAITPIAAASVLAMVQDAIDQNVAFPLTGAALNPDQIGITLATTISTVAGSTQTDKDTATGQAIAAAQDYINNLRVGEPLVINDIAAAIQTSSSKILDVGQPNRQIRYFPNLLYNYKEMLRRGGFAPLAPFLLPARAGGLPATIFIRLRN